MVLWLESIGFAQYPGKFKDSQIDCGVLRYDVEDLVPVLGHRLKIIKARDGCRKQAMTPLSVEQQLCLINRLAVEGACDFDATFSTLL